MCKPGGEAFYKNNMMGSQFYRQRFSESTNFKVSWVDPEKVCGWYPTLAENKYAVSANLKHHALRRVEHYPGAFLYSITFIFTGGVRSPPPGSYTLEPNMILKLAHGLRSMTFALHW